MLCIPGATSCAIAEQSNANIITVFTAYISFSGMGLGSKRRTFLRTLYKSRDSNLIDAIPTTSGIAHHKTHMVSQLSDLSRKVHTKHGK